MDQLPAGSQLPQDKDEDNKRAQEEQMRRDLLATVLDTAARERLSRIALVSPERAKQIEAILLRMAQSGQLKGRVTEGQLIGFLDQMEESSSQSTTRKSTIVFHRRKGLDEDDFDI
ncbi:hypothetical protein AGABI2DRAFT_115232 [Agaricus bisporus var. bisporus H97]|uniref:hypothetical protein n=1 Tax=Agaricus bisporus var. bisporus (strain H97 / ATCC MYA-4626 / FGSC 10389) TaxID=936046 RepID=UPI00029F6EEE|nr:hypothetical protein AGABI2DRAFT_115232 [Agaricus bisporus var. bisporus H97]EKV50176.1 hypothetical protein AGABI2DRAFT_115232 [Agaricus bisporus var. bisporus H97]